MITLMVLSSICFAFAVIILVLFATSEVGINEIASGTVGYTWLDNFLVCLFFAGSGLFVFYFLYGLSFRRFWKETSVEEFAADFPKK